MNTIAGKPLALALLLAAGLLVALFAAGVFTPRGAQAQVTGHTLTLSSQDAGAAVEVTLGFSVATALTDVPIGKKIVIKLDDFGIPSSIDTARVQIQGPDFTNVPADVAVTGSTITIEVGDMNPDPATQVAGIGDGAVSVVIRQSAGITNPTVAGTYEAEVTIADTAADPQPTILPIERTLRVSPRSAKRGAEITVSGSGYANGTVSLYRVADGEAVNAGDQGRLDPSTHDRLTSANVANGSFSTSFTVDHEKFTDSNGWDGNPDHIQAHDAGGRFGPAKPFNLLASIILPAEVTRGKDLTIKLQDWGFEGIRSVMISGATMTPVGSLPSDNAEANDSDGFKVTVTQDAQLGRQSVTVLGDPARRQAEHEGGAQVVGTIDIVSLDLKVQPSTAVVGQTITVTGDGFTNGQDIRTVSIGGVNIPLASNNIDEEIAAGGSVIATFEVPNNSDLAGADDYTIQITDTAGRTGTVDLTIPKRVVSISPTTSRIGSEVTVNCTGFPTGASVPVTIKYDTNTVTSTRTDSSGNCIERVIDVPADAGVGATHKVRLEATVGQVGGTGGTVISAETDHKTPEAEVTLSAPEASRGSRITVSGANFHTFRPVRIDIGDSNVTPSPSPDTDRDGAFSASVLVPGIALGPRNVKVTINDEVVVVSMRITEAPVERTPAAAFSDLGDALEVVWYLDNATKRWRFYDPDFADSDMTSADIASGNVYAVQVSADTTFEGRSLTTGWNNIALR